ncbi:hypothetical protein B0H12DRAFT_1229101 [Mycena haematopus]|nr:hypothetical protein B0H12DRAFT_1229101 [Mycena haematopus]
MECGRHRETWPGPLRLSLAVLSPATTSYDERTSLKVVRTRVESRLGRWVVTGLVPPHANAIWPHLLSSYSRPIVPPNSITRLSFCRVSHDSPHKRSDIVSSPDKLTLPTSTSRHFSPRKPPPQSPTSSLPKHSLQRTQPLRHPVFSLSPISSAGARPRLGGLSVPAAAVGSFDEGGRFKVDEGGSVSVVVPEEVEGVFVSAGDDAKTDIGTLYRHERDPNASASGATSAPAPHEDVQEATPDGMARVSRASRVHLRAAEGILYPSADTSRRSNVSGYTASSASAPTYVFYVRSMRLERLW